MEISEERYQQLIKAEKKLMALEAAGVDNWEWYGEAISNLEEEES